MVNGAVGQEKQKENIIQKANILSFQGPTALFALQQGVWAMLQFPCKGPAIAPYIRRFKDWWIFRKRACCPVGCKNLITLEGECTASYSPSIKYKGQEADNAEVKLLSGGWFYFNRLPRKSFDFW